MKLAYSDVHRYDADPRTYDVPVNQLLSKDYAKKRAALIDPKKANCDVKAGDPVGSNTTYLTVVDKDGNIASWIQSVYEFFGSRATVEGMGFVLQDRGAAFTLDPSSPNVLAGGKRPFHTIIPAFMEKGDQHIGFGIMGGSVQPMAHAEFVSNVVDYGMNIQEAMEAPRFFKNNAPGCDVAIESRLPWQPSSSSPNGATGSTCSADTSRPWAAARRSCTIREPGPILRHRTRAQTAPPFPSRIRSCERISAASDLP